MKDKFKQLVQSWPKLWRTRKAVLDTELCNYLNSLYPNVTLANQLTCLLKEVTPYCTVCGKPVKIIGKKTCSIKCRTIAGKANQSIRIAKQRRTLLKKYGVDNIRNIPGSEEKRKNTMIETYGALVSQKSRNSARDRSDNLNKVGRKTLKAKYNIINPGQLPDHRDKCIGTLQKNYGVDSYFKSKQFIEDSSTARLEKLTRFCPSSIVINSIGENEIKQTTFVNPNLEIAFSCSICGSDEIIPTETLKWRIKQTGTCCAKCGNLTKGSFKETQVKDFIKNELLLPIKENQKLLDGLEIDIVIPELNLGIEFDGLFWHNDLRKDKKYHSNKTDIAARAGIKLIHIFEDEWMHQRNIVESRLRNLTGKISTKIYARTCQIRELSSFDEKKFLIAYHIQGYTPSTVKLGLYYHEELVSVMTFSKPNMSKGQKKENGFWELLRFCSKADVVVVGGANKLFNHFISNYAPQKILTFADRRWSTGEVYKTLGFEFVGLTRNNYWYIDLKEMKRIHRFSMRKSKTDNPNMTEYENRLSQGYLRIWDCGSSKWVWKRGP